MLLYVRVVASGLFQELVTSVEAAQPQRQSRKKNSTEVWINGFRRVFIG
jgi:hypothetical protein